MAFRLSLRRTFTNPLRAQAKTDTVEAFKKEMQTFYESAAQQVAFCVSAAAHATPLDESAYAVQFFVGFTFANASVLMRTILHGLRLRAHTHAHDRARTHA
eukprot:6184581-Pleurochrysis_carterae.AAC.3